jgi:hypothetical protein
MKLEDEAIGHILDREPFWIRASTHNPGFDLYQVDEAGELVRWCEVKGMATDLTRRPATMTRMQFEHARQRGPAYYLYVVEHAGTSDARVVRIQDPAGRARFFTFDRGWLEVADLLE